MPQIQERLDDPEENLRQLQELEKQFYGSKLIRKADVDVVPATIAYTTLPDWVQPVFGRKVWSFLNYEKNVFAILPKERWIRSGWRMLTSAGQSWAHTGAELSGGMSRGGASTVKKSVAPQAAAQGDPITMPLEELYKVPFSKIRRGEL